LKHETLINKRTVYGGGGIMPDVFVPLDTNGITDYYRNLVQKGYLNGFVLEYVDQNRDEILKSHQDFSSFRNHFKINKAIMDEFFEYVKKEDPELEYNDEQYKTSEALFTLRMKAVIAQDIWGYNEFYQIYNDTNEIVMKAVEIIQKGEYDNKLK